MIRKHRPTSSISRSISNIEPPHLLDDDADVDSTLLTPKPAGSFLLPTRNADSLHELPEPANEIDPDPTNLSHRTNLPTPLPPSKCNLFCAFYAEFDIVVGPKVCFQSPTGFMDADVDAGLDDIHSSLEETFQAVKPGSFTAANRPSAETTTGDKLGGSPGLLDQPGTPNKAGPLQTVSQQDSDEYWNWSPKTKQQSTTGTGSVDHSQGDSVDKANIESEAVKNIGDQPARIGRHTRTSSYASSRGASHQEEDLSTVATELQNSIFAAVSEYIITGDELADQLINISTHGMHILSRPMIIHDTQRYERNSLLFAVGFVLRRSVDPRPYWPILANLSSTFSQMEVESQYLSGSKTRPQIQVILEDILVCLNSKRRNCHLMLNDANTLNLQLFRPPPRPVSPVPDFAVPILLRPGWQLQCYDWDLTIGWLIPNIDGCKHVKQIAKTSEVDIDMVRACLRVLRQHGVLTHVDMFRYSNVYECTPLAVGLLQKNASPGNRKGAHSKILEAAFWYCGKEKYLQKIRPTNADRRSPISVSPGRKLHNSFTAPLGASIDSLDLSTANSNGARPMRTGGQDSGLPKSFPSRIGHLSIKEKHEGFEEVQKDNSRLDSREVAKMKRLLSQTILSCNRDQSFGEMLLRKTRVKSSGVRSPKGKVEQYDWRRAFDYFDHRRLITFCTVRGLIRRVHRYPLAYEVARKSRGSSDNHSSANSTQDDEDEKSNHSYDVPLEMSVVAKEAARLAKQVEQDNRSRSSTTASYSPLIQAGIRENALLLYRKSTSQEDTVHVKKNLLERIALAMDGTRCDDELSCMFEMSIESLIQSVEQTNRWHVVSVYSTMAT